jgi:hypothetical protein
MIQVTGILASGDQELSIADPNGNGTIILRLHFKPRLQGWYIDIDFNGMQINGYRLHVSPNLLSQYINRVGFGLAVTTQSGVDPLLLNDFSSGAASLFLLTSEEVAAIDTAIQSGTLTG